MHYRGTVLTDRLLQELQISLTLQKSIHESCTIGGKNGEPLLYRFIYPGE